MHGLGNGEADARATAGDEGVFTPQGEHFRKG